MLHKDQCVSEITSAEVLEPLPSTSGTTKQATQELTEADHPEEEDADTNRHSKKGKGKGKKVAFRNSYFNSHKRSPGNDKDYKSYQDGKRKKKEKFKELQKDKTSRKEKRNVGVRASHKRNILNSSSSTDESVVLDEVVTTESGQYF
ncbi:unnamed protein product [Arctia plantaginis]|uniref:Uncharacterized protein n=1 Tax=Arctia plantaginis TaxID=874455 RepID=A0A8S1BPQ3_ARCPL|nr:unnamed protein product [Arctia plantaginis]